MKSYKVYILPLLACFRDFSGYLIDWIADKKEKFQNHLVSSNCKVKSLLASFSFEYLTGLLAK